MRLWKNSYAGVPINTGTIRVNQKFLCAGLNPLLNNKYYSTNVTSAFANQSYGMYVFPSDRSKNSVWSCIGVMDTSNTNTRYYILKAIPSPSTCGWIADSYTGKQGGKVFDGMFMSSNSTGWTMSSRCRSTPIPRQREPRWSTPERQTF